MNRSSRFAAALVPCALSLDPARALEETSPQRAVEFIVPPGRGTSAEVAASIDEQAASLAAVAKMLAIKR